MINISIVNINLHIYKNLHDIIKIIKEESDISIKFLLFIIYVILMHTYVKILKVMCKFILIILSISLYK